MLWFYAQLLGMGYGGGAAPVAPAPLRTVDVLNYAHTVTDAADYPYTLRD